MRKTLYIIVILLTILTTLSLFIKPTVSFTAVNPPPPPPSAPIQKATKDDLKKIKNIGEKFTGEKFVYKVGFWLFKEVAAGSIGLERGEDGTYIATLEAHTTGFIDRRFVHREDVYTATLKLVDGGKRFMTTRFEKNILIDDKTKRTLTVVDYEKGVIIKKAWKGKRLRKSSELEIPKDVVYDDPLAAFYNFRYGAYGPIKKGGKYSILTFPKESKPEIKIGIWIAPDTDFKKYTKRKDSRARYFSKFHIDKELFDSKRGIIEILFNEDLVPLIVVAKDILMFGDVVGTLLELDSGDFEKYL
ncbi:MAG: DUF3108 domain-containing protein [Thermodesulfobacteriota bacterium]